MKTFNSLIVSMILALVFVSCNESDVAPEAQTLENPEEIANLFIKSPEFGDLMASREKILESLKEEGSLLKSKQEELERQFGDVSSDFDDKFSVKQYDKETFIKAMMIAIDYYNSPGLKKTNSDAACIAELGRCTVEAEAGFWASWWTGTITGGTGSVVALTVYLADVAVCEYDYQTCLE